MSEGKAKRAWFQLHLSTCVVLSLVAGFLFPLAFSYFEYFVEFYSNPELGWKPGPYVRLGVIGVLVWAGFLILFLVAYSYDWAIRRRERKQQEAKG